MRPPTTHELRWFCDDGRVSDLDVAFDALGAPPAADVVEVVHVYLRATEPGLGVKWRDDALELKQRVGVGDEPIAVGPLEARPETWVKWRLDVDRVTAPHPDAWIAVRKWRRLLLVEGCQVELTRYEADQHAGHTLAFETFDPEALRACATRVGRLLGAVGTDGIAALGWPAWLAQVSSEGVTR